MHRYLFTLVTLASALTFSMTVHAQEVVVSPEPVGTPIQGEIVQPVQQGNVGCIDESKKNPTGMCIEMYQPVCGCDGQTYSNSCKAKNAGVTSWTDGACGQNNQPVIQPVQDANVGCIDESLKNSKHACAAVVKPVCGCDGQTYSNSCIAGKAGVTSWTNGACGEPIQPAPLLPGGELISDPNLFEANLPVLQPGEKIISIDGRPFMGRWRRLIRSR